MRTLAISFVLTTVMGFGQPTCQSVGGTAGTNFISQTSTAGTTTGDLKGVIGVTVLSVSPGQNGSLLFHNHHYWVLDSGDLLFFADADATAFPTPISGFDALVYTDGVKVVGGTGKYVGATGKLTFQGAVDTTKGQIVLRYSGQICSGE